MTAQEPNRRRPFPLYPALAALFSALTLALAQPNELFPYGQPIPALFALTPLFIALHHSRTSREAGRLGMLFLAVYTLATSYWLLAFDDYAVWTLGGVVLGYILYGALLGRWLWVLGRSSVPYPPFLLALGWMVYEFFKSTGFLGNPWGLIPYPFHQWLPFIQTADITGLWGLSFTAALLNSLLAEAILHPPRLRDPALLRPAVFFMILVFGSGLYGIYRLNTDMPAEKSLRVILVQKNNDPWVTGNFRTSLREALALTEKALTQAETPPDLVAWSETSLRYPYEHNRRFYENFPPEESFTEFLGRWPDTMFLMGAPILVSTDPYEGMNGTILLNPQGEVTEQYGKQHPVPFAESIPFWEFAPVRRFFSETVGISSVWVLGTEDTLFRVNGVDFTTPICFEDAFSSLCRRQVRQGADVLFNLTNDAWSQTVSAETQHFVVARFRAVENRRPLIRSTNGGVTAVVNPWGEITHRLPLFQETWLEAEIPIEKSRRPAPYTVTGDLAAYLGAAVLLLWAVFYSRRIGRRE